MERPISLDTLSPGFSWEIVSDTRGVKQRAYKIIVSNESHDEVKGIGNMWDSGWVESDSSVNVEYSGKELQSDTTYYWSVIIQDTNGNETKYTTPYEFTTAFFNQTDWQAYYIGTKEVIKTKEWPHIASTLNAPIFRREYALPCEVKRARAYFSGLGWGEMYIKC